MEAKWEGSGCLLDQVMKRKKEGRVGFRDFACMNLFPVSKIGLEISSIPLIALDKNFEKHLLFA